MGRLWSVMVRIQLFDEIADMIRILFLLILPWWFYYLSHLLHLCLVTSLTISLSFPHNLPLRLLLSNAKTLFFLFPFYFLRFRLFHPNLLNFFILKPYFKIIINFILVYSILFNNICLFLSIFSHPLRRQAWNILPFYTYLLSFYSFALWSFSIQGFTQFIIFQVKIIN